MPRTKKQAVPRRRSESTGRFEQELLAVKAELESLRRRCDHFSRTLVRLCCPEKWFSDDIDDADLLPRMVESKSFEQWMAKVRSR